MTKIGKRTGVIVGAIFGALIIIVFLVITKLYKDFINEKK
jgi:tetrahydromethanopterin S-methyltransferase subunit G